MNEEEAMKSRSGFSYIACFYKLDKKNTLAVLFLKIATAVLFSVETMIIAHLIDDVTKNIVGDNSALIQSILLLAGFYILKRVLVFAEGEFLVRLKRSVGTKISSYILDKKGKLSYFSLEKKENQELFRRIGTDTAEKFCTYFENIIFLLEIVVEIMGVFWIVALQNVWIGIVLLLVLIPYAFFSVKNGIHSYEAYEESEELFRRADYYQGVLTERKYTEERTLCRFGDYFNAHWAEKFGEAVDIERKANLKIYTKTECINIFATVVIGIVAFLLVIQVSAGTMTVGFFISVLKSVIHFIETISGQLAGKMSTYEKGRRYARDFVQFVTLEEENSGAQCMEDGTVSRITFKNVTFSYPGSERKIFDNLSFELEGGRQYALVGENGSGKSTLLKILMGFYDNYEGEILINGTDIKMLDKKELRTRFAYVPQEITHYEVRLDEYLRTQDKEKIWDVFEKLGVDIPDGKEEFPLLGKIEENGTDLSGGQWQLTAIARAMLGDGGIYVLDEPTAAIDPIREAELYGIFQNVMKEKFTILVTHRLGAAKMANEILVLKDGQICERGSHSELLAAAGVYAQMYHTQRGWYEQNEK